LPLTVLHGKPRSRAGSGGSLASRRHAPGAAGLSRAPKVDRPILATAPTPSQPSDERKRLAQVFVATCLVVGAPVALVWILRVENVMGSALLGALVGTGMSLVTSRLACWVWEKRLASEDLLFSDLMLWGYFRRRRSERRLESAVEMLGPMGRESNSRRAPSAKRRVRLLEQLVSSVENRDPYLHGHSRRVARHSWMIAKRMGLSRTEVARVRTAAALHDVGKVHTPIAILHKRAPLTDGEFAVIMGHPDEGAEMTRVLDDPLLTSIVRRHHERLDGSGYPGGLSADTIPMGARIIAVADTFDAITSARPYRAARSHKAAFDVLAVESGAKLDPEVVKTFCAHYTGRRTITLWSFFATLPERLVSMLMGGASTAASAAQAVALAAVVGATAAVSAGAALPNKPLPQHRGGLRIANGSDTGSNGNAAGRRTAPLTRTSSRADRSTPAATASSAAAHRTASLNLVPAVQTGVAGAAVGAAGSSVGGPQRGHTSGQSAAEATRSAHAGGGESAQGGVTKAQSSVPRQGSGNPGKSPEKTGGEATHGKSGEAPGHNKTEAGPGKSAEAPGHNKTEEGPGKSAEAPGQNKTVEGPGKSAEAPGQNKTEEAPGNSAEAPGQNKTEAGPGKSGEAHGKG
jgi:putative nucleotidyltransferase with HDIG domain